MEQKCLFMYKIIFLLVCGFASVISNNEGFQTYEPRELASLLERSCFISFNPVSDPLKNDLLRHLSKVFQQEKSVTVGAVNYKTFVWHNEQHLRLSDRNCYTSKYPKEFDCEGGFPDLVIFPKKEIDRSCLLSPSHLNYQPAGEVYQGNLLINEVVDFVNSNCQTFRRSTGDLTPAGHHRQYILNNVFNVDHITNVTIENIVKSGSGILHAHHNLKHGENEKELCDDPGNGNPNINEFFGKITKNFEILKCDKVDISGIDAEEFFEEYVKKSQPVILKNAIENWPALQKWSNEYLRDKYGNRTVHIKMTPGGDFEGVESVKLWENHEEFSIPGKVKEKLPFPDLVVVRPAGINIKFSDFLDLVTWAAQQPSRNVSAYLEYSSIPEYMMELKNDLLELDIVRNKLDLKHLNMWLSDGNTLGRLHFDPYDNLLCQIKGQKQVVLFDPFNNTRMYESHIPQATLTYNSTNHSFRRQTLEDSTSMVMSPVDLSNIDLQRFPEFANARPLNCTIDEGEVLYMPSFWWHEVYSLPNTDERRNLAVNFWYEPFLTKEFPCPECKMDVNPHYYHLL